MKYIILETAEGQKLPIIFPNALTHACVAGAMQLAVDVLDTKKDLRVKQCVRLLEEASSPPISAGFISLGFDIETHGTSESLNLSPGEHDAARIALGEAIDFMPDGMLVPLWAKIKQAEEIKR